MAMVVRVLFARQMTARGIHAYMAAEKAAKEAVTHPEVKERPGDAKRKKSSVFMSMMLPAAAVFTPFTKYAHVW